nr:unnamed protein product [Callosobruchus analis]
MYVAMKLKRNRRQRRFKVRPINRARHEEGGFQYYLKMKSWDTQQFFKYTRMNVQVFEKLLVKIKESIAKQTRSDGISAEEMRLVITLHNVLVPYFFVADEAFPLKQFIMRPYLGKNLTVQQKVFNYRLSRARQTIENSFGVLVARWRILKTTINAKAENIYHVSKAVVVLHNYCLTELGQQDTVNIYCPPGFVDTDDLDSAWREEQAPLLSVGRLGANTATRYLYNLRDNLANYLVSPMGRVPWQNCAI